MGDAPLIGCRGGRTFLLGAAVALGGCAHSTPAPPRDPRPAPRVDAGDVDARPLLGDFPARAARLGAGALSVVTSTEAVDNEWVGAFVSVPAADCLLVFARGASSIEDLDIALYSDEGTSLAVDESRDVHPTVLLCPPHPDRVYAAAHVVDGEGFVAIGAQLVPPERAEIVARALGARGLMGQGPRPADGWPGLEDTVRAHRRELGGAWEEFKRVALSVDDRMPAYASMPIDAGGCVDAVVIPDNDVSLLAIEATDADGRVIARGGDGRGPRMLTVCSPVATLGTLSVRPHVGRGLAAVVLARGTGEQAKDLSVSPQVAWAAPVAGLDETRAARDALLTQQGYRAPVATASGSLRLGRRSWLQLDMSALDTVCGRIDVVAGAPLSLITARLADDAGRLVATGEGGASAVLFACTHGVVRLDLEAQGRPGPFALFLRPERWKDAAFSAYPLAASRMLARAAVGPEGLEEGKDVRVRQVRLDATESLSFSETLPPAKCLTVTVGGQGDGEGLEIRAFDANVEIDRADAADAVKVRACASKEDARVVRFDVRAAAGHLNGILGERLIDSP